MIAKLAIAGALGLVANTAAAATERAFDAYAAPIYRGSVTAPTFNGAQRPYAMYRTRIRASVAEGVGFGGQYALMISGCGSCCRFGYITDLKTGLVFDLPVGGEENYCLLTDTRPDSRLLKAQWEQFDAKYENKDCIREDFEWTGSKFRSLGQSRTKGECPFPWP